VRDYARKNYANETAPGGADAPWWYTQGYQLADPSPGVEWHHVENAVFVQSLEKAADLIGRRGFAIRMGREGLRPSLIRPSGLRITR
jgi:hypothetical protein